MRPQLTTKENPPMTTYETDPTVHAQLIALQQQARTIETILTSTLAGVGHSGSNADMRHILINVQTRANDIARTARKLQNEAFK